MIWYKPWTWHIHRCRTESDETGIWGECITCHRRFGFVTRARLRAYADAEIDFELAKRGVWSKSTE